MAEERVAIITGASSGIGAASAKMMAARGVKVTVNYAGNTAGAEAVVADCKAAGSEALLIQGDVSDDAVCRSIVQQTLDKWGRVDVLVNNAGTTKSADQRNLDALNADDFHRIYGVNAVGTYQMVRAAAPALKASGDGSVVNTSSIAGITGLGSSMAYAASKAAINTMTLSLARSLAPEVRVNTICPGFVDSEWWGKQHDEATIERLRKGAAATTLLGRGASSEEIAEILVFYALGARAVTGQLIVVDNGTSINIGTPLRAVHE